MLNMFLMKLMMVSHDKRQLPPLPVDDSSNSDEVVDADDQKQRKQEARFAKVLSTSMSNSLRLNSKSLSRASLPKFDYASQIKVSEKTFPQQVDQLKVIAFSRNWPEEFITIGGGEWNGKLESDSEKVAIRKECYQWMESSVPQTIKYMITLVRKGDAKGLFTTLWNRFYKVTPLTVGAEVGAFWNLSQKNMAVDQFAAAVNDYSVRLAAADEPVTDQDMATVFVGGLTDKYLQLKERYRDKKVFQFAVVVEDALDFASLHDLLKNASSSTAGTLLAVETVCKFHRMKKGCYAGDKCPLAKTHTKETIKG